LSPSSVPALATSSVFSSVSAFDVAPSASFFSAVDYFLDYYSSGTSAYSGS